MSGWAGRVRRQVGLPPLQEVQVAVQNLSEQASHVPGRARIVFETVADVALLGTVLISGALATLHLCKALFPRHKEDHPGPEPAGGDRSPPRRRGLHATASADDHGRYEDDGSLSR